MINSGREFGATAFNGYESYLEISVQCPGNSGFAVLTLRQRVAPTAYSLYAPQAGTAPWGGLSGIALGSLSCGTDIDTDTNTTHTAGTGLTR